MAEINDLRRQNEDALDMFADIVEPVAEIFADPEVRKVFSSGGAYIKAVKPAVKNHKQAVIEILARLHGVDVDSYRVNLFMIPIELTRLINRPEVQDFLASLSQEIGDEGFSGSPMVNTEADGR